MAAAFPAPLHVTTSTRVTLAVPFVVDRLTAPRRTLSATTAHSLAPDPA